MSMEQLPRRTIYQGRKLDLALQPVRLSDGSIADREVVVHRGAVALLPILDDGRICLIKNFRYTIGKTLIEVPAGTIDADEPPEVTAPRELTEETGYTAGRIEKVAEWYVSPGVMNERMFLFVCRDLVAGERELELDEQLETLIVTWDEAFAMIADGRIEDAKTILALHLGQKYR